MKDQRAAAESTQDRRAAERFAEQLRALRAEAGDPSFRKMAGRSGRISHTTLHEAASGTRFPSWETVREFVRACEADEVQWRRRWEDAQLPGTVPGIADAEVTPVGTASPAAVDTPPATAERQPDSRIDAPQTHRPVVSGVPVTPPGDRGALVVTGYPQTDEEMVGARRHRLPWLAAASVVLVVAMVAVVGVIVRDKSRDDPGAVAASPAPPASPSESAFSDSLIPGDSSKFISDVTIPDGTRVRVNSQFVKVWALKNVGKVAWHNRFLARTNPTADADGCQVPDRVAIGDTPPDEQVMISVQVTAPSRPGKCWVSWKMVDENGQEFFPTRRPVYFMVTVIA
ncbi:NBR1-Ig-like domain-containing protein [Micromonospora sp. DH14]|uniref:NBR1-Ig-like domain-containing protein n=1 Tax=Micromonospora sp. DH14 TaxID=3040120 RepID=UPI00244181E7|nr:NBR1-Ig-like domain-containing protein [Micromonospora sp. DH14]MDG9673880.1 NBR1-Ig-like domain-containing protein [Micromonospora sp. DH14]